MFGGTLYRKLTIGGEHRNNYPSYMVSHQSETEGDPSVVHRWHFFEASGNPKPWTVRPIPEGITYALFILFGYPTTPKMHTGTKLEAQPEGLGLLDDTHHDSCLCRSI